MASMEKYSEDIKNKAIELGFHAAGFADLSQISRELEKFYDTWLEKDFHGDMAYLKKNAAQRFQPDLLLHNAKSAIVVLAPYNHGKPRLASNYKISRYAVGVDYHFVVKQKLAELLSFIKNIDPKTEGRAFTDTAPVPERFLAAQAGLGFIGKNGMLINPELGSYVFIGELYINATLKYDKPLEGYSCGECTRCMQACPNNAIVAPGEVDSRRCISYKTIEHKGEFEAEANLSKHIFGCDICQNVCPFNKNAPKIGWQEFRGKPEILNLSDEEWKQIGSSKFKKQFGNTVLFRTGLRRLRRNMNRIEKQKPDK